MNVTGENSRRWFRLYLGAMALVTLVVPYVWLGLCAAFGESFKDFTPLACALVVLGAWPPALVDWWRNDKKFLWSIIIVFGSAPGLLLYVLYRCPRRDAGRSLARSADELPAAGS